jgi:hypothetical protein
MKICLIWESSSPFLPETKNLVTQDHLPSGSLSRSCARDIAETNITDVSQREQKVPRPPKGEDSLRNPCGRKWRGGMEGMRQYTACCFDTKNSNPRKRETVPALLTLAVG